MTYYINMNKQEDIIFLLQKLNEKDWKHTCVKETEIEVLKLNYKTMSDDLKEIKKDIKDLITSLENKLTWLESKYSAKWVEKIITYMGYSLVWAVFWAILYLVIKKWW